MCRLFVNVAHTKFHGFAHSLVMSNEMVGTRELGEMLRNGVTGSGGRALWEIGSIMMVIPGRGRNLSASL